MAPELLQLIISPDSKFATIPATSIALILISELFSQSINLLCLATPEIPAAQTHSQQPISSAIAI